MSSNRRIMTTASTLGLLLAGGVAGLGFWAWRDRAVTHAAPAEPEFAAWNQPVEPAPYIPGRSDQTVDFYVKQVARDPKGVIELRGLAAAYLARQRETGDIADAVKAEDAARRSLVILRRGEPGALGSLGRALLAQHRFAEALEAARAAAARDPAANRLLADVLLELGDYDEAAQALAKAPPVGEDPNYLALKARIEQINGNPELALRLLKEARRMADSRPDMPAEAVAWYRAMVGHAAIELGRFDEGEQACREAIALFPRDHRAMTALAEAAAWRGDWRQVAAWGEKAVAVNPQNPVALKLVADAWSALDRSDEAERYRQILKDLAHSFPSIHDRHWALACADAGRDLDEALALARKDLEARHDVQAFDTLAWVCWKKGSQAEAESAMKKALERGTRQASLFYHAGMIARTGNDPARAKEFFLRARELNPRSVPARWIRWMESPR